MTQESVDAAARGFVEGWNRAEALILGRIQTRILYLKKRADLYKSGCSIAKINELKRLCLEIIKSQEDWDGG